MQKFYLLAVLAAVATVAVCQLPADLEKFHRACLDETKLSEDELKQFLQNGMKASEATENIKCHAKCMMQKQGILKDGVFDADAKLKELLQIPSMKGHETEIKEALSDCKNEKGANECDTAFKITMCLKDFSNKQIA